MSKEITFILEPDNGKVTTEVSGMSAEMLTEIRHDLGDSQKVNCAKPLQTSVAKLSETTDSSSDDSQSIWLYRIYHNSVVDGPGRRSVIQVVGCSIRCPGCYVPETHKRENGSLVPISPIINEIVANRPKHDGVTILGGEPFDQAASVAELVSRLNKLGVHVAVYTGNTIDTLIGKKDKNVDYILTHIDLLIDEPFVRRLQKDASEYTGSSNQKMIEI